MLEDIFDINMGFELPSQTFFEPNRVFYETMIRLVDSDRLVYDMGAGLGHITEGLLQNGIDCIGIDNAYRNKQSPLVKMQDALSIPLEKGRDIILTCRPDHSGWVEELYHSNDITFIYVGLTRNLDIDLDDDMRENMVMVAENVGNDGENVYLLRS